MPSEHVAGSKAVKNRRSRSVASQFAHPLTGETVKERQVKWLPKREKMNENLSLSLLRFICFFIRTFKMFEFLSPFYFIFLNLSL